MKKYPFFRQLDSMDRGPSCLKMIAAYYGRRFELVDLREMCYANRNGVTMLGVSDATEVIGFRSVGIKTGFERLSKHVILPCIIHWRQDHFAVVYKVKVRKKGESYSGYVIVQQTMVLWFVLIKVVRIVINVNRLPRFLLPHLLQHRFLLFLLFKF